MANDIEIKNLLYQSSNRHLSWKNQDENVSASYAVSGTANVSGVDVSNHQKVKVMMAPTSGSVTFNVQVQYEGFDQFLRVDGSSISASYPWTQQYNVSGVKRMYVGVENFSSSVENEFVTGSGWSLNISAGESEKELETPLDFIIPNFPPKDKDSVPAYLEPYTGSITFFTERKRMTIYNDGENISPLPSFITGSDASQGTTTNQASFQNEGVIFDGNDYYTLPEAPDAPDSMVFCYVGNVKDTGTTRGLIGHRPLDADPSLAMFTGAGIVRANFGKAGIYVTADASVNFGSRFISIARWSGLNGSTQEVKIWSRQQGTTNSQIQGDSLAAGFSTPTRTIGALETDGSFPLSGSVDELWMLDNITLSDEDVVSILDALENKYNY